MDSLLDADGNVPPHVIYQGFKSLKPTAAVTQYVDLWQGLWSDDYVASYQALIGGPPTTCRCREGSRANWRR